jgi:hypothetical protein
MISDLRSFKESEMLRSWAIAEVFSKSTEIQGWYKSSRLSPEVWDKVQNGRTDFSESELVGLEAAVRYCRALLLNGLLSLGVNWHEGKLSLQEFEAVRMIHHFAQPLGSGMLIHLVRAYLEGKLPKDLQKFGLELQSVAKEFRIENMTGKLILVAKSTQPPYFLIEGYKRMCSLLLSAQSGKSANDNITVILGVTPRLNEWGHVRGLA